MLLATLGLIAATLTQAQAGLPAGVEKRLTDAGLSKRFVKELSRTYQPGKRDVVVPLKLLGFLKTANYEAHLDAKAVPRSRAFLKKHERAFAKASERYQISPEAVAALLWVETKHGKTMGKFHVPSVFVDFVTADDPALLKEVMIEARKLETDLAPEEVGKQIAERAATSVSWAITQLKALEEMHARRKVKLSSLKGSYAGAFGVPQFIPESYLRYAQPGLRAGSAPDLFRFDDAIFSVASYLSANGWKEGDPAAQEAALFHYNRSKGYVKTILALRDQLVGRAPATSAP